MSYRPRLRGTSSLVGGVLSTLILAVPALAFAQAAPATQEGDQATQTAPADRNADGSVTEVDEVVVTGSRIPTNEFTSTSPIQVLTAARAEQRGLSDTAQLLQSSTIAAGSPQVNATISSAFVTDGGPGASTISLRGLGANRTLVLLNGRRAGPAGTRGGVSAFDLNVIPQSAINRVDILKDGASSIYGSDAVAGVVNLITEREYDGGEMSAFATAPFKSGGEQFNISGTYGKTFDRGYLNLSLDYYRQEPLKAGQRDYLICTNQYVFQPGTSTRGDRIDPRTGQPQCTDTSWGQVYVYDETFSPLPGRLQFNYDGDLGKYIPRRPTNGTAGLYPSSPQDFYVVNYDPASRAVTNNLSQFAKDATIIPEVDRYTAFAEGRYDVGGGVELYGEFLLNRRESRTDGYRQFWNYTYTRDFLDQYGAAYGIPGLTGGDPVTSFTGLNILSATPVTDHFDASQKVDYMRGVLGVRGDLSIGALKNWKWDVYAQYSRSDGDYTQDVILKDAVDSTSFKTQSCVGQTLPISGRKCIDVDFTKPAFLAGNLTDAEKAFLFDTETGNTVYEQSYVEGFVGGNLFDLPAGPLGLALGFHVRHDSINDVPGAVTLASNSWGLSGAGITKGTDDTREVFGEMSVPLLKDVPFAKDFSLSLSGRYTDTKTSGDASTYKVGLNWAVSDAIRFRATRGTSFRAPALFELYLADQTSFIGQRSIDPCINLAANTSASPQLIANCTSTAGPGGGVSPTFGGGVVTATVTTGGGLGVLKPETSTSTVLGVVLTPPGSNLSLAVDYFDIDISDEVTTLGSAAILAACYTSNTFPTDPICRQFVRNPTTKNIDTVSDSYLNVAEQKNRGLDFTARYRATTPWFDLTLDSQTTWTLENKTALFAESATDPLGQVGYPELVGNINATFARGPWTLFWGFDWIGNQDSLPEYFRDNGTVFGTVDGRQVEIKAAAEFTSFHSVSLSYEFDNWKVLGGVANLFDEKPPAASSITGQYSVAGNSVFGSQYTEGFYGRRAFVRLSTSF